MAAVRRLFNGGGGCDAETGRKQQHTSYHGIFLTRKQSTSFVRDKKKELAPPEVQKFLAHTVRHESTREESAGSSSRKKGEVRTVVEGGGCTR